MTRALIILTIVTAMTYGTLSFLPSGSPIPGSGAALAFGFLLIAALQVARVGEPLRFPHLTGYLLCGLLFGPEGFGLVSARMLGDLALIKGTAVGLIALLAGCELNLRRLRPKLREITAISAGTMIASAVMLIALFFWITSVLPATADFSLMERVAVTLIAVNVLCAFSPSVVIAIISETRARGPLSELCMSIVIVADLAIVLTFSLTSTFARNVFPTEGSAAGVQALFAHIFGSMAVGVLFGAVLWVYVRRVKERTGLFTFALLFIAAEAGRALHLDPLLVGLSMGLFIENVTPIAGEEVVEALQPVTIPTFVIFFAVIGAEIQLQAFLHVAPFAIAAAILRAIGIYGGAIYAAGRSLGVSVGHGLVSQAGVALALSVLILNDFEPWGRVVGTILLGCIVVNQLVGPILFRRALAKAGEISEPLAADHAATTPPATPPAHA